MMNISCMENECQPTNDSPARIRMLIVDDRIDLAKKLQELMETVPGVETVGLASNGREGLRMAGHLRLRPVPPVCPP